MRFICTKKDYHIQFPKLFNFSNSPLLYIIYFLGICYIALMAYYSIRPDVFFSGDGGVKYIVVKQIAAGEGFKYLHITQPEWVKQLWSQGFFPLIPPFTYPSSDGYVISFPPAFQVISSFFYAKLGYAGLYIIPIGGIILLWASFLNILTYLGIDLFKKSVAFFLLVFCCPLTIYAVIFWEHTAAVFLLFAGVVFIIRKETGSFMAIVLGLCSGLAVWLRPEALVMNFLYTLAVLIQYRKINKRNCFFFLATMLIGILCFFITNHVIYGAYLGVHGHQVLAEDTLMHKILRGIIYIIKINWLLAGYFCITLLCVPLFFFIYKKRTFVASELVLLSGIILLFCIITPFIVPNIGGNQWGPRYFLPIMPLILIVLTMAWQQKILMLSAYANLVIVILILYSLYVNLYEGGIDKVIKQNPNRVKPAMDLVMQQSEKVVIIGSEFIPMEMGAIFKEKYFLFANTQDRLDTLNLILRKQGVESYIYITDKNLPFNSPNLLNNFSSALLKKGNYYMGKYKL